MVFWLQGRGCGQAAEEAEAADCFDGDGGVQLDGFPVEVHGGLKVFYFHLFISFSFEALCLGGVLL